MEDELKRCISRLRGARTRAWFPSLQPCWDCRWRRKKKFSEKQISSSLPWFFLLRKKSHMQMQAANCAWDLEWGRFGSSVTWLYLSKSFFKIFEMRLIRDLSSTFEFKAYLECDKPFVQSPIACKNAQIWEKCFRFRVLNTKKHS